MKPIRRILPLFAALMLAGSAMAQEVGNQLNVYSGTGSPDEMSNAIVDGYVSMMKEKYGVDIDVQLVSGSAATSWVTFNTEWPNPSGDVYQLYTENVRQSAPDGRWLNLQEQYTPEEWARFDADGLAAMNTGGFSLPMELAASVLVVQDSLPEGSVTSWDDLGNPEFARRTTFESAVAVGSGYNVVAAAAAVVGSDWNTWFVDGEFDEEAARPAFEKVRDWADNALTLTQGSGSIRPLLARGEALISNWWWHSGVMERMAGVQVHTVYPVEGVPAAVATGPVVASSTQNPIAAIEWVKYFHSAEAGKAGDELGWVSRFRQEGEDPSEEWDSFRSNADIIWVDTFRDLAQSPEYNQAFLGFYNRVVIQGQ
ncbi:extracellular solute-binding protein [Arsenicitalea aurantiaca]|uniref:Extracellular solute-binding protein n=1 Tax=Arsenicitalea aurantiaca TaxID=1783274 RepID=A0A433X2N6_9HYPH|nr:extracellular solute-binding protein [Arsenicitalea aurantiaca]RUT28290.1 extracellular solute-binding protein [Arsenicitalea aurantiaca]